MKLTLVNECGVALKFAENSSAQTKWWEFSFVDVPIPDVRLWQDIDFMAQKIVWSKITDQSKIRLDVYLYKDEDTRHSNWLLQVESAKRAGNILKKICEAFGGRVNISVCIKPTETDGIFIFQQGIKVEGNGICTGEIVSVDESNLHQRRFNITINADIPNDHELVREAQDFLLPLRITKKILDEGLDSNVVIIAGNGTEVKTHKNFLMASSKVMRRMFENEMEESKTGRIEMTDLTEDGVKALLRYIYCGDKIGSDAGLDLAFELLYASHKYEVSGLEEFMVSYWIGIKNEKISAEFAFKLYMFVRNIKKASQLKAKMACILHRKYDELKVLPEYKELFKTPSDAMELCDDLMTMSKKARIN